MSAIASIVIQGEFLPVTEKIYSSAVWRCQRTAEIISDGRIPVVYDQRLLEVFSAYQGYWIEDWSQFFGHRYTLGGDPLYFLYQHIANLPLLPDTKLGEEIFEPEG